MTSTQIEVKDYGYFAGGHEIAEASTRHPSERAEISFGLKVEDYRRGRTGAIES